MNKRKSAHERSSLTNKAKNYSRTDIEARRLPTQKDYLLANLAADNVGNIWIHNFGSGTSAANPVVKVSNTGAWQADYLPPTTT